ncbi:hypothetical protein FY145_01125 [Agrobacterium tumefaciens]|uniref:hypothetical protein n=1 Tax=Agrobacterium tumefaciens TaxID=358 RepID=UPI0021CF7B7A|nr:hypothetical protein [Agrobacterium tumefaciens]UXS69176.1 hypothetical protein FY146_01125 [Agrobacterium tumefaciens]UXS76839.1 hypothetical protein FY145_01125 [Agrobacterium tumefaciens]
MTIAIGFGWWVVPALITVLTFGYAAFMSRDMGNDRFGAGAVIAFGFYLLASVASLLAWLIWSLAA